MARYTLLVDAISKSHAATGLRVGWGVFPPWILAKTQPLIGHMGAWAARPEQHATAALLADPGSTRDWMAGFKRAVENKLTTLNNGIQALKAQGRPVDALAPQGAIYLSVKIDLLGRTLKDGRKMTSDDDIRRLLLEDAGIAVVPFTAFGLPYDTGWARMSVGAVGDAEVEGAVDRLGALFAKVL
jgi:aspartate aminotransferase